MRETLNFVKTGGGHQSGSSRPGKVEGIKLTDTEAYFLFSSVENKESHQEIERGIQEILKNRERWKWHNDQSNQGFGRRKSLITFLDEVERAKLKSA